MDNKSTQKEVFNSIETERRWQELERQKDKVQETLPVSGELVILHDLIRKAFGDYAGVRQFKDTAALDVIRQIAATSVRCLEHHGVIERVW